ncbi:hypothetical protein F4781DRAFT_172943 [Annulohypoxylon bovei var. microspora]|nr:hypothetical protein F4781DRAFT_172943 [Annulohypoxylon bovei var. microspora]
MLCEQPMVDANTGALTIQNNIITKFEWFSESNPGEFTRTVPFSGTQGEFQWLVKTDSPVNTKLDVVANIPGCGSYLHLRKDATIDSYAIIGKCHIGFRQGPIRAMPWFNGSHRFASVVHNHKDPKSCVVDIDILGRAIDNCLCASYGFDKSFIGFSDELHQSRLGHFLVSCLEDQGLRLSDTRIMKLEKHMSDEVKIISPIWKTISGWRAVILGSADASVRKNACNMLTELLKFWSRPMTWGVLDAIQTCIDSIEDLAQTRSDWNQIAKSLAAIESGKWSHDFGGQPDMASLHVYAHNIEPQTALRLDLPQHSASIPCLISALNRLTIILTQHLELKSDLFNGSFPGVDLQGVEEGLSSAERVRFGRLYTRVIGSEAQNPELCSRNPLITLGTELFYAKVQSRIATLQWLRPSWESFQGRLVEFRQVYQHMLAIDAFQEGISEAKKIIIV